MNVFSLRILAADKSFYEGDCESLIIPTVNGRYGIMAHHRNMVCAVVPGEFSYKVPGQQHLTAAVSEGLIKVENNTVLVLVDSAERPEEIDENRAKHAAERAKEELLQRHSLREYKMAQANLARALSRLRVRHNYNINN